MAERENREQKRAEAVVQSHFDKLCEAIENASPTIVSRKLFEKKLITQATHGETDILGISKLQQATRLMNAMMAVLSTDDEGKILNDFLAVLRNCGYACSKAADAVQAELSGVAQPVTSSTSAKKMNKDLNEANIMDVLHQGGFANPDWKRLGSALGLSTAQLDSIGADKRADNPAALSNALINMLSTWLRRDLRSSWEKLAEALGKLEETNLSEKVRVQQDELTVNSIHDLLSEEGFDESSWHQLGINLGISQAALNGIAATHMGTLSGAQVHALIAVLSAWLRQDLGASWDKLANALRKIKYPKIAAVISP